MLFCQSSEELIALLAEAAWSDDTSPAEILARAEVVREKHQISTL